MTTETDNSRELLRHTLATVAYRGGKALRTRLLNSPRFARARRLAHRWRFSRTSAICLVGQRQLPEGNKNGKAPSRRSGNRKLARFFAGLNELDQFLASAEPLGCSAQQLFQGPIADALTHIGQIAMLRRMAGTPVRGENFFIAEITAGRVGAEQSAPRYEFD